MSIIDPRNWPAWIQIGVSAWIICTAFVVPLILQDLEEIAAGRDDQNEE